MQPCAVRREDRIGIAGFVRNDIAVGREVERPGILDGGGGISWSAARRPLAKYLSSEENYRREYHQMFRGLHPPNTSQYGHEREQAITPTIALCPVGLLTLRLVPAVLPSDAPSGEVLLSLLAPHCGDPLLFFVPLSRFCAVARTGLQKPESWSSPSPIGRRLFLFSGHPIPLFAGRSACAFPVRVRLLAVPGDDRLTPQHPPARWLSTRK